MVDNAILASIFLKEKFDIISGISTAIVNIPNNKQDDRWSAHCYSFWKFRRGCIDFGFNNNTVYTKTSKIVNTSGNHIHLHLGRYFSHYNFLYCDY